MVEMTMQVPDKLAQRLRPMSPWLATVLELSLVGLRPLLSKLSLRSLTFCPPVLHHPR